MPEGMVTVTVPSDPTESEYCQLSRQPSPNGPAMSREASWLANSRLKSSDKPVDGTETSVSSSSTGTEESPTTCMISTCQSWLTSVTSSPSWPR